MRPLLGLAVPEGGVHLHHEWVCQLVQTVESQLDKWVKGHKKCASSLTQEFHLHKQIASKTERCLLGVTYNSKS